MPAVFVQFDNAVTENVAIRFDACLARVNLIRNRRSAVLADVANLHKIIGVAMATENGYGPIVKRKQFGEFGSVRNRVFPVDDMVYFKQRMVYKNKDRKAAGSELFAYPLHLRRADVALRRIEEQPHESVSDLAAEQMFGIGKAYVANPAQCACVVVVSANRNDIGITRNVGGQAGIFAAFSQIAAKHNHIRLTLRKVFVYSFPVRQRVYLNRKSFAQMQIGNKRKPYRISHA